MLQMPTLSELTDALKLSPLPVEGGLYRQTYCSEYGTAIYYLLHGEAFSHFHRLQYDEIYHFYLGDPVALWELLPDGRVQMTVLGTDVAHGECVQHVVPAGNWQGSCLLDTSPDVAESDEDAVIENRSVLSDGVRTVRDGSCGYALLGTTMSPGYTDDCYEHGSAEALLASYPEAADAIRRLCRGE